MRHVGCYSPSTVTVACVVPAGVTLVLYLQLDGVTGCCILIHIGHAMMHYNGTIEYFLDSTFNVPTLAEAYKVAALDGIRNMGGGPA